MIQLTQLQKDLLIGSLLGDGNLQTNTGNTWRYRAIQKALHQPYIEKKYDILKDFCNTPPSYSLVYDSRTGKSYDRYTFNTLYREEFQFFGNLFYTQENGIWVKHVPSNIATFLTPTALAYWYMDDGALKWAGHSNAVRICTDSFTSDEVEILKNALESNFQLEVSIQKKGGPSPAKRLTILENSYTKLKDLILTDLLPCMYYKFPDGNRGIYQDETVQEDLRFIPKDEL
jgi:hypothetical protein